MRRYTVKQLRNGKFAVGFGKDKFLTSTVSDTKEAANVWRLQKQAEALQAEMDKLWLEFHDLPETDKELVGMNGYELNELVT